MKTTAPLLLALSNLLTVAIGPGCTALIEAQAGYAVSPSADALHHSGDLALHVGGAKEYTPGRGLGVSARVRGLDTGFVAPELGPHAFLMYEEDRQWALYGRLHGYLGLGYLNQQISPTFAVALNPGLMIYPHDDDATFWSLSLLADYTAAPVAHSDTAWFGLQVGFGVGGIAR